MLASAFALLQDAKLYSSPLADSGMHCVEQGGGAVRVYSGTASLTNVAISSCTASASGGNAVRALPMARGGKCGICLLHATGACMCGEREAWPVGIVCWCQLVRSGPEARRKEVMLAVAIPLLLAAKRAPLTDSRHALW